MTTSPDVVRLTLPAGEEFISVARIVVGGVSARHELSYESLDDIQLAVEAVLGERRYAERSPINVEIEVADESVGLVIGPVDDGAVRSDLTSSEPIGLRVVLGAVVDGFSFEEREGCVWIRLEKRVPPPEKRA